MMNLRVVVLIVFASLILGCSKEGDSMPEELKEVLTMLEGEWQVIRNLEIGCNDFDELSSTANLDFDIWVIDSEGNYAHYYLVEQIPVQGGGTIKYIRKEGQYDVLVFSSKFYDLDTNELYFKLDQDKITFFENVCEYNDVFEDVRFGEEWERVNATNVSASKPD